MSHTYLVFSDDWGAHPSSCQHLFKRISRRNAVIWVNTIMRMPSLTRADFSKIWRKLTSSSQARKSSDDRSLSSGTVTVIRPVMIPLFNNVFRSINRKLLTGQIKRFLRKQQVTDFTVVTTLPIVADTVTHLGAKKIVYYCVDEFAEWPGHNRQQMRNMETDLLAVSDVVITTSQTLYESKKSKAKQIFCLPHGVDVEHFSPKKTTAPDLFPHPLLGYYGLFDERNDLHLIEYILRTRPDWHIMVIGEVRGDTSRIATYTNMHFYRKVPYEQLPGLIHLFDMCILPYVVDALTENINPLKFKEYLATGLPVVTTALPDLRRYNDVIGWATDAQEFIRYCEYFLEKETPQERRERIELTGRHLHGQSWEAKTQEFLRYIHNESDNKEFSGD